MIIVDSLLKKITGFDPAAIRSEDERRAYRWLHRYYSIALFILATSVPLSIYLFITVYLPELRK